MRNDKVWKLRGREMETETLSGKTTNGSDRARVHKKKKVGRVEPQKITDSHATTLFS